MPRFLKKVTAINRTLRLSNVCTNDLSLCVGDFKMQLMLLKLLMLAGYSYDHVSSIHSNGVRRKTDRLADDMVREIRDA